MQPVRLMSLDGEYLLGSRLDAGESQGFEPIPSWEASAILMTCLRDDMDRLRVRGALADLTLGIASGSEPDDLLLTLVPAFVERGDLCVLRLRGGGAQTEVTLTTRAETTEAETAEPAPEEETHWIEITVVDQDGNPARNVAYELTLPSSRVTRGRTNDAGAVYLANIDPGSCKLRFPELDASSWELA